MLCSAALLMALATVAGAQLIDAPDWSAESRAVGPMGPGLGAGSGSGESLYRGSLSLKAGDRGTLLRYRDTGPGGSRSSDTLIVISGSIEGREAALTAVPIPGEYPGYNYSRPIRNLNYRDQQRSAPFTVEIYLPGVSEGLYLRHDGGDRLIIRSVERRVGAEYMAPPPDPMQRPGMGGQPGGQPWAGDPGYNDNSPQAVRPVAPPSAWRPPQEPAYRPPVDGYPSGPPDAGYYPGPGQEPEFPAEPTYPPNYPGNPGYIEDPGYGGRPPVGYRPPPGGPGLVPVQPGPPNRVVLFSGDLRVRQDETSRQFLIPDGRVVRSIDVFWTDKDHHAQGFLLLNNDSRPSLGGQDVGSPDRARWTIGRRLDSFRFMARGDHLWIQEVVVTFDNSVYEPEPGYGPGQPDWGPGRPPVGGGGGENLVNIDGPIVLRRNRYSEPFYTEPNRRVERIVVYWDDFRENAVGHVVIDNESWEARRGSDVESPGTATFSFNQRMQRFRIYARNDDIRVMNVKIYYGR